jgi:hypothetical protein
VGRNHLGGAESIGLRLPSHIHVSAGTSCRSAAMPRRLAAVIAPN